MGRERIQQLQISQVLIGRSYTLQIIAGDRASQPLGKLRPGLSIVSCTHQ
jgi:hypothetical protein